MPRVYLTDSSFENPQVPPSFCLLLRKHIGLGKLTSVIQPEGERILDFVFAARGELGDIANRHIIAEIMGRNSNIILCDEEYKILGMARLGGDLTSIRPLIVGMKYEAPPTKETKFECDYMESSDISADIEAFYAERARKEHREQVSRGLLTSVEQKMKVAIRKRIKLEEELEEAKNREEDRLFGELLTANIYQLQQGETACVENYYTNEKLQIPLDGRLSIAQNATRYYKRYEKKRRAEEHILRQIEKCEREIEYLESVRVALDLAEGYADFEEIRREIEGALKSLDCHGTSRLAMTRRENFKKIKPIMNIDGFDIYVGKNNTQNDYLSLKFAHNMDVWLHVQKQPGSHVLIRTNGREVPPEILEEAARLAKGNSKAKDENKATIDYCLAKYVKKPNGAKPGFVIYSEFSSIVV